MFMRYIKNVKKNIKKLNISVSVKIAIAHYVRATLFSMDFF